MAAAARTAARVRQRLEQVRVRRHARPSHDGHHDEAGGRHASAAQHLQRIRELHLHRADLRRHPAAQHGGQQLRACACSASACFCVIMQPQLQRTANGSSLAHAARPVSSGERLT